MVPPIIMSDSLIKIRSTNQRGMGNEGDCQKASAANDENIKILSATGSRIAPRWVGLWVLRARYPSKRSVVAVMTNKIKTLVHCAFMIPAIKKGVARIRNIVKKFEGVQILQHGLSVFWKQGLKKLLGIGFSRG